MRIKTGPTAKYHIIVRSCIPHKINKLNDMIKKGKIILTEKPFTYILNSECKADLCDNCLKSGKLSKCSVCQYVYYCNRNCQKESWSIHKTECENFKRISPKVVPDTARLMARVIIKLNQGGTDEMTDKMMKTNFRKFKDLMSHYSDIKKDAERMENFTLICKVLVEYLGETLLPNVEKLMDIYCRICINSFNILGLNQNIIGEGIYLDASVIDHACEPNAVVVFEGTTMVVRTLVDIPYLDWSQIRILYINPLHSKKDRRELLYNLYYFWCNCKKCERIEPMAEAAACPNSSCTSPCSIEAEECDKCGTKLSEDIKKKFREIIYFTSRYLEHMEIMADLDDSKTCLKKQEGILHKFNIKHIRTLQNAHWAAVKLESWEDAELYNNELIPGYIYYYNEVSSITGLQYLTLEKIQLHLKKPKEALKSLEKASRILEITHGDTHPIMKEQLQPCLGRAVMEAAMEAME